MLYVLHRNYKTPPVYLYLYQKKFHPWRHLKIMTKMLANSFRDAKQVKWFNSSSYFPIVFTCYYILVPILLNCDQICLPSLYCPLYCNLNFLINSFRDIFFLPWRFLSRKENFSHALCITYCMKWQLMIVGWVVYMPKCKVLSLFFIICFNYFTIKLFHLFFVTEGMSRKDF